MKLLRRVFVVFSFLILSNISAAFADPISDALLDGAADKAKEVIARAEAAGDAIAKAFGEQALAAIEALRVAARDTTMIVSQELDARQTQLFNDLQSTLDQLMAGESVAMDDLTRLTAALGGQIKNLPFTDQTAEVMMYQPRVVVANGPSTIALKAIGPKLGDTKATLTFGDKQIPLSFSTDQELVAQIDRKILPFPELEPAYATFKLTFDRSTKVWWQPWTWFASDVVARDLTLMLMPKRMAHFQIATTINQVGSESKDYVTTIGGGAKDRPIFHPVGIPPLDKDAGWQIDTDKLLAQGLPFANVGGDQGDCVGMVRDQLSKQQLIFHLQFGHRTKPWGEKEDGWVNCQLTIPLIRGTTAIVSGGDVSGDLTWLADKRVPLPANLNSYTVALTLYDGHEYILDASSAVPYGLLQVERSAGFIQFRPRAPRDF